LRPPQGPPTARHPASDVASELAAEKMRVHLLVAARLYNNGRFDFASQQMSAAKDEYAKITDAVRLRDGALDREFHAAFPVIALAIALRYGLPRWLVALQTLQLLGVFFAIVYLGDHYVVDALGGAALGVGATALVHALLRRSASSPRM